MDRRPGSARWMNAAALLLAVLTPHLAFAHPGHGGAHGFGDGFLHPLLGWDHLLAMLAVGIWAGQRGGRSLWLVPSIFVLTMAVGGFLGFAGVGLPGVEAGILSSVLVLGALIAAAVRLPLGMAAALVGVFALFHGHAHGAEMPVGLSGFAYGAGFCAATALLHLVGMGLPFALRQVGERLHGPALRLAGAGIGMAGLLLILA